MVHFEEARSVLCGSVPGFIVAHSCWGHRAGTSGREDASLQAGQLLSRSQLPSQSQPLSQSHALCTKNCHCQPHRSSPAACQWYP